MRVLSASACQESTVVGLAFPFSAEPFGGRVRRGMWCERGPGGVLSIVSSRAAPRISMPATALRSVTHPSFALHSTRTALVSRRWRQVARAIRRTARTGRTGRCVRPINCNHPSLWHTPKQLQALSRQHPAAANTYLCTHACMFVYVCAACMRLTHRCGTPPSSCKHSHHYSPPAST